MWRWFQKTADRLQAMDWSPEMKETIAKIDKVIPKIIKDSLFKYITITYQKTSRDIAERVLKDISKSLEEIVNGK